MAERVPGGMPCWRACFPQPGFCPGARLFAGLSLWPPEHRAGALLSLLDEGADRAGARTSCAAADCGGHADVELVPLLEVLVFF